MKTTLFRLGLLLLLGVVILNIFWGDSLFPDIKTYDIKKSVVDIKSRPQIDRKKEKNISMISHHTEKEIIEVTPKSEDITDISKIQRDQDLYTKRMLANEYRQEKMLQRKAYERARREWRRSLNQARKEAKISGDYSQYERIKSNEPGKTKL